FMPLGRDDEAASVPYDVEPRITLDVPERLDVPQPMRGDVLAQRRFVRPAAHDSDGKAGCSLCCLQQPPDALLRREPAHVEGVIAGRAFTRLERRGVDEVGQHPDRYLAAN